MDRAVVRAWSRLGAAFLTVAFTSGTASADVFSALSAGVQCAKAGVEGAAAISADMAKKAAAATEAAAMAGTCTAVQGGNAAPFAVTLGALSAIKIASPETLPDQQCFASVKKHLARPLAEGLALAVPVDSIKSTLVTMAKSELASDALWETLNSTPVLTPYTLQVDCACTTIDAGMTLADFSTISGAVKKASKSCGKFLDEAGLGFINDYGDAAIDAVVQFGEDTYDEASGAWDKHVLGQSKHAGPDEVYGFYFGRWEYPVAVELALNPDYTFDKNFGNEALSVDDLYGLCVKYYDDHTMSKENAVKTCDAHRSQFWTSVKPAGEKLHEYGELPDYYLKTVKFLVEKDWRQRLPMRLDGVMLDPAAYPSEGQFREWSKPETASLFQDVYGGIGAKGPADDKWEYPNATGGLRAAREALATTQTSKEQATIAAYTGLKPRLSQAVLDEWNARIEEVTSYWLAKMLPGDPMAARYGCPAAPFEEPCIARLRTRFQTEEICFPEISRRMAEMPTLGHAVLSAGLAVGACKAKLAMTVDRARFLGNYGLIDPAADMGKYCSAAGSDRNARAQCGDDLKQAADACIITGIAEGQGDAAILACYGARGKKVAALWLSTAIDPADQPAVDEPVGGKIRLKRDPDLATDEMIPDEVFPEDDGAEPVVPRAKREAVPSRRKAAVDEGEMALVPREDEDGVATEDGSGDPSPRLMLDPRQARRKAIADAIVGGEANDVADGDDGALEAGEAGEEGADALPAEREAEDGTATGRSFYLNLRRKPQRGVAEQ